MINTQRLPASKKRIYDILNQYDTGVKVLNNIKTNSNMIRSFSSINSFYKNKNILLELLRNIAAGVGAICAYVKSQVAAESTLANEMTQVSDLNDKVFKKINDFITNFTDPKNTNSIKNFVNELNDIEDFTNYYANLSVLSIFKQIHTIVYNFILNILGKGVRGREYKNYSDTTDKYIYHKKPYTTKDIKEKVVKNDKTDTVLEWITSRWNWTLPICCIDKIIHCVREDQGIEMLACYAKDLYRFKYLGNVLKCSAESFISCYEFGMISDNKIFRTTKKISNNGNGLFIDIIPYNKVYNFKNLKAKATNSGEKFYYVLLIEGQPVTMDQAIASYGVGDLDNTSSTIAANAISLNGSDYLDRLDQSVVDEMELDGDSSTFDEFDKKYGAQFKMTTPAQRQAAFKELQRRRRERAKTIFQKPAGGTFSTQGETSDNTNIINGQ